MRKLTLVLIAALFLSACGREQPSTTESPADAAPADADAGVAKASKANVFPAGFSLPFAHHVRANRQEKFGGSTKRRVVVEIRGVSLDEADKLTADAVAKNGYTAGERVKRDDGFVVTYSREDGDEVQTSFFTGQDVKFENSDATGIVHVTWIERR
jgi:hypothetical protein